MPADRSEDLELDGHVVHRTDAAVLFFVEADAEQHWFPLSVCRLSDDEESVLVPMWLAKKLGLD